MLICRAGASPRPTMPNVILKECYAENPACSCVMDYAKIFAYSFIGYYNIVR